MIIPLFLMSRGCPHRCVFCNERLTAGDHPARITETAFVETVRGHLAQRSRRPGRKPVQIAFYGGTFGGLPESEQHRLLALAAPFLAAGAVDGIRISTRPEAVDREALCRYRAAGVTTVEIGTQSLDDEVLQESRRGHSAADTARALALLRQAGLETGLHLMAGLPGDTPGRFAETVRRAVALRPDMVRLHPTVVLRGTALARDFRRGGYRPQSLAEATDLCKDALLAFRRAGIPVIRLGLQTTAELEAPGAVVAGPFHPAFRDLVESALFRESSARLLATAVTQASVTSRGMPAGATADFRVAPADLSCFLGPRRSNLLFLRERCSPADIRVTADPSVPRGEMTLTLQGRRFQADGAGRVSSAAHLPSPSPAGGSAAP